MRSITSMTSYNLMVEPTLKYAGNILSYQKNAGEKKEASLFFCKPLRYTYISYIKTGWWFQPIWKICSSNWVHLLQFPGENKQYLSCHQLENIHPVMKSTVMSPSTPKKRCLQLFATLLTAQGDHLVDYCGRLRVFQLKFPLWFLQIRSLSSIVFMYLQNSSSFRSSSYDSTQILWRTSEKNEVLVSNPTW